MTALYLYKLNSLKLDKNINTVVLGDSQSQTAFNDSLTANAVNYSHNSEHFFLTYNVLKLIVKNNPQIRTLILGCSFHSISAFNERYLFGERNKPDNFSKLFYPRYFSMLDNESKLFLIERNLPGVIKSFRGIALDMITSFTENYSKYQDYPFVGRYYPGRVRTFNDSLIKESVVWHFYSDSTETQLEEFSSLQSEYLEKIISFCKEHDIKVILLNTPVHELYYKQIPEKYMSHYYSYMKELEKNDNVTLYDYYNYKLPDEYFGDGNHLNRTGASVFTPMIMNRINSN